MSMVEVAVMDVPLPTLDWAGASEEERILILKKKGAESNWEWVDVLEAKENGYVVVSLKVDLDAAERGRVLLDIEENLKEQVDPAITIWLEPKADKSALRKFRGIEVKQ